MIMGYYKQGDAARAKEIKAAFEAKGIHSKLNFENEKYLYFSCDGVVSFSCIGGGLARIIKSHPDYKELELPVEPKFKVGDWVVRLDDEFTVSIKSVRDVNYYFNQGGSLPIKEVDEYYHLWTIADAKDGDVLVLNGFSKEYKWIGIFKALTSDTSFSSHCHYNCGMCEFVTDIARCTKHGIKYNDIRPATNEERVILFAKMREAGYEWDSEKKELRKIQSKYDISNFHEGMPVLVREYDTCQWQWVLYSHFNGVGLFFAAGKTWRQCIPFNEKTKHLLGTTGQCGKEYINW